MKLAWKISSICSWSGVVMEALSKETKKIHAMACRDNRCISPKSDGVRCGRPVATDRPHGWLCAAHESQNAERRGAPAAPSQE